MYFARIREVDIAAADFGCFCIGGNDTNSVTHDGQFKSLLNVRAYHGGAFRVESAYLVDLYFAVAQWVGYEIIIKVVKS